MTTPVQNILSRLRGVKRLPTRGWIAFCPAHNDRRRSLKIDEGRGGEALLKCFAGCTVEDILKAINLQKSDLFPRRENWKAFGEIIATYDYRDANGKLLFQVCRTADKRFFQRRPDGKGGWVNGLGDVKPTLYKLPQLLQATRRDETIFIVEGEKDVHSLERIGLAATTNPMGAGKWRDYYSDYLRGANVIILPDNDQPGREHAQQVARSLYGKAASVRVLELPGLPQKGDISDWLAAGGTKEELLQLARECPDWKPAEVPRASFLEENPPVLSWPEPPAPDAFCGLAGDIVRAIDPHTEADPVALLAQVLICYGSAIGRAAHFIAEADKHYLNEFCVLVGTTGKGRKGTSAGQVRRLFELADPEWTGLMKFGGLSSGEGLIWAVRDPIEREQPVYEGKGQDKRLVGYETVVEDKGVVDKRLLVYEAEFASTLRVLQREGNILSAIIRNAWDFGHLEPLTKNNRTKAIGAHISIIGHITKDELLRYLDTTEAGNGFGNRFLWLCVRRSKVLPEGGNLRDKDLLPLAERLRQAITFAKGVGEMGRDEAARRLWWEVYPELSEGKPGLLGAMTARAEAHTMRLACIYALLDLSAVIQEKHLRAALSLWDYCERSARFIFGDALGDPVADEILRLLRATPEGMTRTEISNYFGRHLPARRLGSALAALVEHGLAESRKEQTDGRAAERWFIFTNNYTTKKTNLTKKGLDGHTLNSFNSFNSYFNTNSKTSSFTNNYTAKEAKKAKKGSGDHHLNSLNSLNSHSNTNSKTPSGSGALQPVDKPDIALVELIEEKKKNDHR